MTTQTLGTMLDDPVPRDSWHDVPDAGSACPRPGDAQRAALESLLAANIDGADRDSIAAFVRQSHELRGWLDAFDVRCMRRTNTLAQQGRSESGESLIGRDGNRSARDARMTRLRADTCDLFLLFEQALTGGEISAGHVDALGLAIRDLSDDQRFGVIDREARLVESACRMSVDDFSRHVRVQVADVVAEQAQVAAARAVGTDLGGGEDHTDGTERIGADSPSADDVSGSADDVTGSATAEPSIGRGSPAFDPQVVEYERQRNSSRVRRWRDAESGMCMTMLALDPIRDAVFKKAFDAHRNRLRAAAGTSGKPWSEVEVDSFMSLVAASVTPRRPSSVGDRNGDTGSIAPTTATELSALRTSVHLDHVDAVPTDSGLNVPEFCAVIGWDRLLDDACTNGLCETSDGQFIPPASLRRMLCDAAVYPVVLGGDGQVLDAGRTTRTVTREQRRALRAMHRTCGHPACQVPFDSCRIHHIRWWTRDRGPTDLENLLPLCETHHHLVHEGGWALTMTPARVATWVRPDGTTWITASTADRAADVVEFDAGTRHHRSADEGMSDPQPDRKQRSRDD